MAKDKSEKRFIKTYSDGVFGSIEIFVDRKTGVNYIFKASGYAGGLCPLIDAEGKPIVTPVSQEEI
ncbi:MAG: xylan 1,4-beta-xylosidase [Clostridia bacterium]|nr:xylan 1,4-beta-xylosidase [Clostridia bacterium]